MKNKLKSPQQSSKYGPKQSPNNPQNPTKKNKVPKMRPKIQVCFPYNTMYKIYIKPMSNKPLQTFGKLEMFGVIRLVASQLPDTQFGSLAIVEMQIQNRNILQRPCSAIGLFEQLHRASRAFFRAIYGSVNRYIRRYRALEDAISGYTKRYRAQMYTACYYKKYEQAT